MFAISFVLLSVSGRALFHPAFYWLSNLCGGGVWTRILHPFLGVLMFVCFAAFAARMFSHNLMTRNDVEWDKHIGAVLNTDEEKIPVAGCYNGGQKQNGKAHVSTPITDAQHVCRLPLEKKNTMLQTTKV